MAPHSLYVDTLFIVLSSAICRLININSFFEKNSLDPYLQHFWSIRNALYSVIGKRGSYIL